MHAMFTYVNDGAVMVLLVDDEVIWQREAAMRMDKFNQVHLVAGIPAYDNLVVKEPVEVFLIVKNTDGKQSDPQKFYYTPSKSNLLYGTPGRSKV